MHLCKYILLAFTVVNFQLLAIENNPVKLTQTELNSVNNFSNINFEEIKQTLSKATTTASLTDADYLSSNFFIDYQKNTTGLSNNPLPNEAKMNLLQPLAYTPVLFVPDNTQLTSANNAEIKAGYQKGRFSAETGLVQEESNFNTGERIYVKGSFAVLSHENFTLSVTARFETLNANLSEKYFSQTNFTQPKILETSEINSPTGEVFNSTLGIVGKYSLNQRWSVVGSFTASSYNVEATDQSFVDHNLAIIGTHYAF